MIVYEQKKKKASSSMWDRFCFMISWEFLLPIFFWSTPHLLQTYSVVSFTVWALALSTSKKTDIIKGSTMFDKKKGLTMQFVDHVHNYHDIFYLNSKRTSLYVSKKKEQAFVDKKKTSLWYKIK